MIAVELMRRSRSADAIGPCGSNTPAGAQEERRMAAPTGGQLSKRERHRWWSKLAVFLIGRLNMANPLSATDPIRAAAANQLAASNISPTALLSRCILATSRAVTSGLA